MWSQAQSILCPSSKEIVVAAVKLWGGALESATACRRAAHLSRVVSSSCSFALCFLGLGQQDKGASRHIGTSWAAAAIFVRSDFRIGTGSLPELNTPGTI